MGQLRLFESIAGLISVARALSSVVATISRQMIEAPLLLELVTSVAQDVELGLSSLQNLLSKRHVRRDRLDLIPLGHLVATLTEAVLTFSEFEGVIIPFATSRDIAVWSYLQWAQKENIMLQIITRLQRHKSSLSLMLDILQRESDSEAQQCRATLQAVMKELLSQNRDISNRLRYFDQTDRTLTALSSASRYSDPQQSENSAGTAINGGDRWCDDTWMITNQIEHNHDERDDSSRASTSGQDADDWAIINQDEQKCNKTDGAPRTDENGDHEDVWVIIDQAEQSHDEADSHPGIPRELPFRPAFHNDLKTSQVHKTTQLINAANSSTSPAVQINASHNPGPESLPSSVISLPLYWHEISNRQWYTNPLTEGVPRPEPTSILPSQAGAGTSQVFRNPLLTLARRVVGASERINSEWAAMVLDPTPGISVSPVQDDPSHWHATIIGPNCSPYSGGIFSLDIRFPPCYPFRPPDIRFTTRIYHPNISCYGDIGIDLLQSGWSPAMKIDKVLLSIQSILPGPLVDDGLTMEPEITKVYFTNRDQYEATASEWTIKYASSRARGDGTAARLGVFLARWRSLRGSRRRSERRRSRNI